MLRSASTVAAAAAAAHELAEPCRLCPHRCGVRRLQGETGRCGAGASIRIARALPHFGEEPPLCGPGGAAALFFAGCTLGCVFCQNHQISRGPGDGDVWEPGALAHRMLELQASGCSHLDLVSPTPYLPWILDALALAREQGLVLPAVVNSNGFLSPETEEVYCSACEIQLLDLKYDGDEAAVALGAPASYPAAARAAVRRAHEVLGPLAVDDDGLARRGLLVRHLVIPGHAAETEKVLGFLATLPGVSVSLLAQYHPPRGLSLPPPLDRALTVDEYDAAIEAAGRAGLDDVYLQEPGCGTVYLPDFRRDAPFVSD